MVDSLQKNLRKNLRDLENVIRHLAVNFVTKNDVLWRNLAVFLVTKNDIPGRQYSGGFLVLLSREPLIAHSVPKQEQNVKVNVQNEEQYVLTQLCMLISKKLLAKPCTCLSLIHI